MANVITIRDLSDPALDVYFRLTEAQLKNQQHREKGVFIAESLKVIQTALSAGCRPVSFLAEEKYLEQIPSVGEVPVYTAPREQLLQMTGYALTRGVLCAIERKPLPSLDEALQGASRVAVADGIADSTNLGALFRSAAALGMDAVICTSTCCDPLLRRSVRVSMGTVFQIPWTVVSDLRELKKRGFSLAAMALREDTVCLDDPVLAQVERLGIVLGSEGWGLSHEQIALCDYTVKIPMFHGVDSLNVAAASAVAFWQLGNRKKS